MSQTMQSRARQSSEGTVKEKAGLNKLEQRWAASSKVSQTRAGRTDQKCSYTPQGPYRVMDVLHFAEGSRIGSSHSCGVLQISNKECQLPCIANGIQLLLLGITSHVHQAMHEAFELLHLATLCSGFLLTPHKPVPALCRVRLGVCEGAPRYAVLSGLKSQRHVTHCCPSLM